MGLRVPPIKPLAFGSAVVQCAHCGTWRKADILNCDQCGSVERRSAKDMTGLPWQREREEMTGDGDKQRDGNTEKDRRD
jgi:hypothetical protein